MLIYYYWMRQGGTLILIFIFCMSYVYFQRVDAWLMISLRGGCMFCIAAIALPAYVFFLLIYSNLKTYKNIQNTEIPKTDICYTGMLQSFH